MATDHDPELVEAVQDAADKAFGSGVLTGPSEATTFLEHLEREGFTIVATDDLVDVAPAQIAPAPTTTTVINVQVTAHPETLPDVLAALRDLG